MTETTPTNDIEAAFEYAQKIRESYSFESGPRQRESITQKEADKHAITLLKNPESQDFRGYGAESALLALYDHVGYRVKTMYSILKKTK